MSREKFRPLPPVDPLGGGELVITEVASMDGETVIRGKFGLPRFARLTDEQREFLETFLRCRGIYSHVEKEMGISYPTVKARLESLLKTLDLEPVRETPKKAGTDERRLTILDQLERGEITPEEAKVKLREIES